MKMLDVFAGIGGFSLAGHALGWETVGFVEKDPFCQKVLYKNFGFKINLVKDIHDVSTRSFPRPDIITGGFPCQPFSQAGESKGAADERHLFPQMLRIISEYKPRWIVAENVRGLIGKHIEIYEEIIKSLEGIGYETSTFCISASAVGACHRRDRVWIIGSLADSNSSRLQGNGEQLERATEQLRSLGRGDRASSSSTANTDSSRQPQSPRNYKESGGWSSNTDSETSARSRPSANTDNPGNDTSEFGVERKGSPDFPVRQRGSLVEFSGQNPYRDWFEAATELCRVDDGLSPQLDKFGNRISADNRTNRIKVLGNSVYVPLAYHILKAIDDTEKAKVEIGKR